MIPSNPYDAKGLLLSAIRDEDPVIFFEPKKVYRASRGDVPEGEYIVPLGEAAVVREGSACTVISYGAMLHTAVEAADRLRAEEGLDVEVIDLRTLVPIDIETVVESVEKTGRCVVVVEAPKTCSYASEVVTLVQEHCFLSLEARSGG